MSEVEFIKLLDTYVNIDNTFNKNNLYKVDYINDEIVFINKTTKQEIIKIDKDDKEIILNIIGGSKDEKVNLIVNELTDLILNKIVNK